MMKQIVHENKDTFEDKSDNPHINDFYKVYSRFHEDFDAKQYYHYVRSRTSSSEECFHFNRKINWNELFSYRKIKSSDTKTAIECFSYDLKKNLDRLQNAIKGAIDLLNFMYKLNNSFINMPENEIKHIIEKYEHVFTQLIQSQKRYLELIEQMAKNEKVDKSILQEAIHSTQKACQECIDQINSSSMEKIITPTHINPTTGKKEPKDLLCVSTEKGFYRIIAKNCLDDLMCDILSKIDTHKQLVNQAFTQ